MPYNGSEISICLNPDTCFVPLMSLEEAHMKVLVATDGSERSMKAVRRALELAENEGADVTMITVAPSFSALVYDADELPAGVQEALDSEAMKSIDKAKALFAEKGVKVVTMLKKGRTPANVILEVAEEGKFDLILMGSTGKTALEKYLIGTTASKVVANAPCSVAVIR
jgi:nucleotide-binding universal stress UspA family protein